MPSTGIGNDTVFTLAAPHSDPCAMLPRADDIPRRADHGHPALRHTCNHVHRRAATNPRSPSAAPAFQNPLPIAALSSPTWSRHQDNARLSQDNYQNSTGIHLARRQYHVA